MKKTLRVSFGQVYLISLTYSNGWSIYVFIWAVVSQDYKNTGIIYEKEGFRTTPFVFIDRLFGNCKDLSCFNASCHW